MKRLALAASIFFIAACAPKEEAPVADSAAPAVAPAPAAVDTSMAGMTHDSAATDTTKK